MRKTKKSKYKSLKINNKRYYFYKIVWIDIVGDAGHADSAEFLKLVPAEMVSYGYVFSKDNQCVRTFASYDTSNESFSDRNVYPTGCIRSMQKINI